MNKNFLQKKNGITVNNLNMFSQVNIDGLSGHSKTALDKFTFENNISLVALQETKLNQSQIDNLDKFENLESFLLPKSDFTYGVGLLISPVLLPQRVKELEEQDCDIIWCMTKFNNTCVLTASAYTPPNNISKLRRLLANINQAEKYAMKNTIKNILVFGDFNGRNIMWGDIKNNSHGQKLLDFIDSSNFMLCTPADKTFIAPNNGGSVIDLLLGLGNITDSIIENWTDRCTELYTGAPIRGHFPVLYSLGNSMISAEPKQYNDYNNTDWSSWKDSLELSLSNLCHNRPAHNFDTNVFQNYLVNGFNEAIQEANKIIPKKIISKHTKPFWTESLSICSQELQELNIAIRCRCTPTNNYLFRTKKEEFKSLLIKEKNRWIRDKLSDINISDSKKFWKRYKSLFQDKQANYIGNLSKNGLLFTSQSDKDKVLFREFFTGEHLEGHDFDNEFADEVNGLYNSLLEANMDDVPTLAQDIKDTLDGSDIKPVTQSFVIDGEDPLNTEITLSELNEVINEKKTEGKSTDSYEVNPTMFKHLGLVAKSTIIKIFNLCLKTGHWCWNNQDICFIKKTGKPSYLDPGAYRPISLSSNIGKLLEKILEKRLRVHCNIHDILGSPQEGFCANRSTTRYLFKLLSHLGEAKKKKLISMVLLIDFQKAFDSVWIPGLVIKLYNYGIKGKILQLLNNFLSNRHVRLKINGKTGEFHKICSLIGLPQGSVLSPLLFILYISEMLENFHNVADIWSRHSSTITKAYKYADDGTLSVTGNNILICHVTLQAICNQLFGWCMKWRLVINCDRDKTEVLIINGSNNEIPPSLPKLKIGNLELQYVIKSRVLGIVIDKDLSFSHHAKDILKRCWYQWYKIMKGTTRFFGLNTSSLTLLFKTMVLTKLMYAAPVWLDQQLEIFNNLWSRVLLKLVGSAYHTEKAITEALLNLPPLEIQLEIITVKFLLKCLYSDDEMIAILLTVDDNPQHPVFTKAQQLKKYILWKTNLKSNNRCSTRRADLINFLQVPELSYYTKGGMQDYSNALWWRRLKHTHPHLDTEHWGDSNYKFIFPRGSDRGENTRQVEFIHGHSLSFQNFSKTVGLSQTNDCILCNQAQTDSNSHQLFECIAFECEFRKELLNLMDNNIADFQWHLSVSTGKSSEIISVFLKLASFIVERKETLAQTMKFSTPTSA